MNHNRCLLTAILAVTVALCASAGLRRPAPGHMPIAPAVNDTVAPDTLPDLPPTAEGAIVPTVSAVPNDSATAAIVRRLHVLTENTLFDRTQLGLYVYDLTADAPVFAQGEHQQLRPASCQKILTAVTALSRLGTDYKYTTRLYTDGSVSDSVLHGDVYLRGDFDPLLDASDLAALAGALAARGIGRIDGRLCFDRTLKDTATMGWGWCWDDDTTPLTPLLYEAKPGLERHFANALREAGISCADAYAYEPVGRGAELVAERTHTIDQILLPMMKESDNLFAESLFYQLAARSGRAYAGRKRAARQVAQLLADSGVSSDSYQIADGSGLSLYNYLTPAILVSVLRHAYRDEAVYRHLLPALPVAGEDGTLRRRMATGATRGNVHAKTGTVEGVSTLAGYCTAANGHVLCFAIMNQGVRHAATGRNFQDRVCRALVGD